MKQLREEPQQPKVLVHMDILLLSMSLLHLQNHSLYTEREKYEWLFYFVIFCRYLSNRIATSKSDVYAFGVVLYEIISGKKAIIQTQGTQGPERRSLAYIVSFPYLKDMT